MVLHMFYGFLIGIYLCFGVFVARDFKNSTYTPERVPEFLWLIWTAVGWLPITIYHHVKGFIDDVFWV